jgi:hypothetical protein
MGSSGGGERERREERGATTDPRGLVGAAVPKVAMRRGREVAREESHAENGKGGSTGGCGGTGPYWSCVFI